MSRYFEQGHALVVGVGRDLPNTITDAEGIARILHDPARCAYPEGQVTLLTAEHAAKAGIVHAFDHLAATTDDDSTVVIYFSGHGYRDTSAAPPQYYLMPYDYEVERLAETGISDDELSALLDRIAARKMLLLFDCCHAGGFNNVKAVHLVKAPLPEAAVSRLAQGKGYVIVASSRRNELSYTGDPYSSFTQAVVEALSGLSTAQQDGYVRVADLAMHAKQTVPQLTNGRQNPILDFKNADNFAVAYYAGGATEPIEASFSSPPMIHLAAGNKNLLHQFPRGPRVPSHLITLNLVREYAAHLGEPAKARGAFHEAVNMRLKADPPPARTTVVRWGDVPAPGIAGAFTFWEAALKEACLHGPRMVAAFLYAQPDTQFEDPARADRQALLDYMQRMASAAMMPS